MNDAGSYLSPTARSALELSCPGASIDPVQFPRQPTAVAERTALNILANRHRSPASSSSPGYSQPDWHLIADSAPHWMSLLIWAFWTEPSASAVAIATLTGASALFLPEDGPTPAPPLGARPHPCHKNKHTPVEWIDRGVMDADPSCSNYSCEPAFRQPHSTTG